MPTQAASRAHAPCSTIFKKHWRTPCTHAKRAEMLAAVATFNALVRQKWRERETERGKAAAERKEQERELAKRQAALAEWLEQLGLGALHKALISEGVDLRTLQFVTDADLQDMGITQLAQRRQLMAAVKTQNQYKAMTSRLSALEAETAALRQKHAAEVSARQRSEAEGAAARDEVAALGGMLEMERARATALEAEVAELRTRSEEAEASGEQWRERAEALVTDTTVLQDQVLTLSDSHRHTIKDIRTDVDRKLANLLHKLGDMQPGSPAGSSAGRGSSRSAAAVAAAGQVVEGGVRTGSGGTARPAGGGTGIAWMDSA